MEKEKAEHVRKQAEIFFCHLLRVEMPEGAAYLPADDSLATAFAQRGDNGFYLPEIDVFGCGTDRYLHSCCGYGVPCACHEAVEKQRATVDAPFDEAAYLFVAGKAHKGERTVRRRVPQGRKTLFL